MREKERDWLEFSKENCLEVWANIWFPPICVGKRTFLYDSWDPFLCSKGSYRNFSYRIWIIQNSFSFLLIQIGCLTSSKAFKGGAFKVVCKYCSNYCTFDFQTKYFKTETSDNTDKYRQNGGSTTIITQITAPRRIKKTIQTWQPLGWDVCCSIPWKGPGLPREWSPGYQWGSDSVCRPKKTCTVTGAEARHVHPWTAPRRACTSDRCFLRAPIERHQSARSYDGWSTPSIDAPVEGDQCYQIQ